MMLVKRIFRNIFLMEENNGGEGTGGGAGVLDGGENSGGGNNSGGTNGQGGEGSQGGGGENGSSSGGQNASGGNNTQGGQGASQVQIPENWQEVLPEEIRNQVNIKNYKTVEAMARGLISATKLIGADKVAIPKDPNDQQIREINERLGLPKEMDKYELTFSDATKNDPEFMTNFKDMAFKAGVLPRQAQAMLSWMENRNAQMQQNAARQAQENFHSELSQIKSEWGDAFNENSARAKAALKEYGASEDDIKYFKENLTVNGPVLRLLAKVGSTLDEGKIRGEGGGQTGGYTPQEAQMKIAELKTDVKGPYWDKNHSEHNSVRMEVARLYKYAYPEKRK